jgi:hypothetical protein
MTNESDVTSTRSDGRTLSTEELDQIVGGRATGDQHNLLSTTDDAALLHGSNEPPPMPQIPKGGPPSDPQFYYTEEREILHVINNSTITTDVKSFSANSGMTQQEAIANIEAAAAQQHVPEIAAVAALDAAYGHSSVVDTALLQLYQGSGSTELVHDAATGLYSPQQLSRESNLASSILAGPDLTQAQQDQNINEISAGLKQAAQTEIATDTRAETAATNAAMEATIAGVAATIESAVPFGNRTADLNEAAADKQAAAVDQGEAAADKAMVEDVNKFMRSPYKE